MEDLMMGCKVDGEQININRSLKYCGQEEEMIGVREENLRLKTLLQKIEKDYKSLQMKYINVFQQESRKNGSPIPATAEMMMKSDDQDQELVSLRLGTSSADSKKGHNSHVDTKSGSVDQDEAVKAGPEDDPATSKREDDRGGERAVKAQRSGDDEFSQTSVKRARVCVRARCDTPTMNDGCQWRKYGQKISKGNPCPRAYYRCTVSPTCPVRKQVQRFVEDMSILITTYEGTHNHPLPLSATAMASTTSAAASMLLSGSTTSQPSSIVPTINMYGQPTFHPYDTSRTQPPPPYFISNSSSNSSPTITLDLIANPQSSNTGFGLYSSTSPTNPRFPTTNLSFSSMDSNMAPTVWGGGYTNQLMMGRTGIAQQQKFEPYAANLNQASSQNALTETLTKVISSDPSFRSAIAAAISTMAAGAGARKKDGEVIKGENLVANSKWGEQVPAADPNSLS